MKATIKQKEFIESDSDITIMGGGAGGGMTMAIVLGSLQELSQGKNVLILAPTLLKLRGVGGLFDKISEVIEDSEIKDDVSISRVNMTITHKKNGCHVKMLCDEYIGNDNSLVKDYFSTFDIIYGECSQYLSDNILITLLTGELPNTKVKLTSLAYTIYDLDVHHSKFLLEFLYSSRVLSLGSCTINGFDGKTLTVEYIGVNVYDNPYLVESDPVYIDFIESSPIDQKRTLLEGEWFMNMKINKE